MVLYVRAIVAMSNQESGFNPVEEPLDTATISKEANSHTNYPISVQRVMMKNNNTELVGGSVTGMGTAEFL